MNMKPKHYLLVLISYLMVVSAFTQSIEMKKPYDAWIQLMKGPPKPGKLLQLSDHAIVLSNPYARPGSAAYTRVYNIQQIKTVMVRKKGSIGRGAFVGALLGGTIGVIAGSAAGDDSCEGNVFSGCLYSTTAKTQTTYLGFLGACGGSLIGMGVGSAKIRIPINGEHSKYKTQRKKLLDFIE